MISYMILQKSYVFHYDINESWYYPWHHGRFHTITSMMSMSRDINAVWYHIFHDILAHIMAPGRRDGGGWERHRDSDGPAAAPTYWIKLDAQQIYSLAIQVVQSVVAFRTRPPRLRVTQSGAPGRRRLGLQVGWNCKFEISTNLDALTYTVLQSKLAT